MEFRVYLVISHTIEVFIVEIMSDASSEVDGKTLVKIIKITVDKRCRNSAESHASDFLQKHAPVHLNNGFDNTSLNGGDINGEERSKNQEDCQETYIISFSNIPTWEENLQQMKDSFDKNAIDFSSILIAKVRYEREEYPLLSFSL